MIPDLDILMDSNEYGISSLPLTRLLDIFCYFYIKRMLVGCVILIICVSILNKSQLSQACVTLYKIYPTDHGGGIELTT